GAAGGDLLVRPLRLGERALAEHGDERVQLGARLDAPQASFRQFYRRDRARAEQGRELDDRSKIRGHLRGALDRSTDRRRGGPPWIARASRAAASAPRVRDAPRPRTPLSTRPQSSCVACRYNIVPT